MLQIMTGKFYEENIFTEKVTDQDIFYSNLKLFDTIKLQIGTLEPIKKENNISSYLFKFHGLNEKKNPNRNYPEAIEQFKLLCFFYFQSIFTNDKNDALWICRENHEKTNELVIPKKIIPNYFNNSFIDKNLIHNFGIFINKVLELKRKKYKSVLNSINALEQAIDILNYNYELAFSLVIYSLESLSQKFDKYEVTWEDYNESTKTKLENLFKDKNEPSLFEDIKNILIEDNHPKLMSRFIDFCTTYIDDDFFKNKSLPPEKSLRNSELKQALRNAYNLRSGYVHNLKKLNSNLEFNYHETDTEIIRFENNVYLTFNGLIKIAHNIITNFINNSESLKEEKYPKWRNELLNICTLPLHPKYWISNASIFKNEDIFLTFSNFLMLYQESFITEEIYDLSELMDKIKNLLKKGVKKQFKPSMLTFYYIYNELYCSKDKKLEYVQFMEKNKTELNGYGNIENLVSFFILGNNNIPWNLEKVITVYKNYRSNKFKKNIVHIPQILEVNILLYISNEFLIENNLDCYQFWLNETILELPGKNKCQVFLEKFFNKQEVVNLDDFNKLFFNKNTT